ncbi:MAG: hypothetical protein APF81_19225 [Desulfosporosinus sp. BRH_c37]|nr:MAG: hypothetical protein APF81_19225 [Desulfosporosinus sp. BRH_c37]
MKINSSWTNIKMISHYPSKIESSNTENFKITDSVQKSSRPLLSSLPMQNFRKPELDGTHERNINQYVSEIQQLLKESGLTLDGKCSVTMGSDGRLAVNGTNRDKDKLESILNSNEGLAEKLRTEMALQSHAERMKESLAFNKAYAQNMKEAVAQYRYLLNDSYSVKIILEIGQDSYNMLIDKSI